MSHPLRPSERLRRRLDRQFDAIAHAFPFTARPISALRGRGAAIIRLPVSILLIIGSLLSFLPVLGLWMLPVGLLLLAVDLPVLRPFVTTAAIRFRIKMRRWRRRLR